MVSRFLPLDGPHRKTLSTLLCLVFILTMSPPARPQQPNAPPAAPSSPQIVVVVNMRTKDLAVVDHKYRVFFNKFEVKYIPVQGYDLPAAVKDEVLNALSEDGRARWRAATAEETVDPAVLADDKKRTPEAMAAVKAERVLVVDVFSFQAYISGLARDRIGIYTQLWLLEPSTGRKLWKKGLRNDIDLPAKLDELQADNQKKLKEALNKILEDYGRKVKTKVGEQKL